MGCDGGTIPRRDELVKTKAKTKKKDKDAELAFRWRHCFISQQLFQLPIVMCGLGYLYNKLALIEALLNNPVPDCIKHIKSLKDVRNLNLTPNPEYKTNDEKKEGSVDYRATAYICPVIGLEMSGNYRFIGLWSCGCVFSERALKEVCTNICHKCQMPFESEDVVILNGNEEDQILMKQNMEKRQQKNKKVKSKRSPPETIITNNVKEVDLKSNTDTTGHKQSVLSASTSKDESVLTSSTSKDKSVLTSSTSKENAVLTSSTSTDKPVLSSSTSKNENSTSVGQLALKRPLVLDASKGKKKIKKDYSVAKDPKVSDVYKSLFTTHQSEKQQNRAHWITYNPFYN